MPAMVLIVPPGVTFRMRLLARSEMYRFPEASTARPFGVFNDADVAGPPSPEKPWVPLPATVEIIPLGDTLRTRLEMSAI